MSAQSQAWNEWLDAVLDGQPCTADTFARSAIGELPRVTIPVRQLDPAVWGHDFNEESGRDPEPPQAA